MAAGTLFAAIGMVSAALAGPPSADELAHLAERIQVGRLWVVEAPLRDDAPAAVCAYLSLGEVDDDAYLEQVSLDPAYSGRGLGRELIEYAAADAAARGRPRMTLTTYAQVAWNAPYYERLGFRRLTDADLSPGLRAIREREAALGLDEWPRVAMARLLA